MQAYQILTGSSKPPLDGRVVFLFKLRGVLRNVSVIAKLLIMDGDYKPKYRAVWNTLGYNCMDRLILHLDKSDEVKA